MKKTLSFPSLSGARRLIGALLSCVLLLEPILADAASANVWAERRRPVAPALAGFAAPLPPLQADRALSARLPDRTPARLAGFNELIPAAPGRVTRVMMPERHRAPPVILLQDVHGSGEAQKNLADALDSLIRDGRLETVALEGAEGAIDLSHYARFSERDVLRASTDFLLEQREISGPAHLLLNHVSPPAIIGVEEPALYRANGNAVQRGNIRRNDALAEVETARGELNSAIAHLTSPRLRELHAAVSAHRTGDISLAEHARRLAELVRPAPVVRSFLEAARLEDTIDFSRAQAEREGILERLVHRLPARDLKILTDEAARLRLGARSPADFYRLLDRLGRTHGVALERTPAFAAFVRYILLADAIDGDSLWRSLRSMEAAAFDALAETEVERRLVRRSRRIHLAERLVEFALTADDWVEWDGGDDRVTDLAAFEAFYKAAERRDAEMADRVRQARGPVALIVGGFHSSGIARRLTALGHPVLIWTPEIRRIEADGSFRALGYFAREKTPLEEMFEGEKLFLAPPPFRGTPKLPALVSAMSADPQAAVNALWPEAKIGVSTRKRDGRTVVNLNKAGRAARIEIRTRDGAIKGFTEATPSWFHPESRLPLLGWRYRRIAAAVETVVARVIVPWGVHGLLGAPGAYSIWLLPLAAAFFFWAPHVFRGRRVLFSRNVLRQTAGTAAAASILALTPVIGSSAIFLYGAAVALLAERQYAADNRAPPAPPAPKLEAADPADAAATLAYMRNFLGLQPGQPFNYEALLRLHTKFEGLSDNESKLKFTGNILRLLFQKKFAPGAAFPPATMPQAAGPKGRAISVDGPTILDLSVEFSVDPQTGELTVAGAAVKPGSTGPNAARVMNHLGDMETEFFGFAGDFEGQVFSRTLNEELGGAPMHLLPGKSRTSLFLFAPAPDRPAGSPQELHLRPRNPDLTPDEGRQLMEALEALPPVDDRRFVILGGQVFAGLEVAFYTQCIRMLKQKGYRVLADFKPYLRPDEMNAILTAKPTIIKPNLEEFSRYFNFTHSDLKGMARLLHVARLALLTAKAHGTEFEIVSMEGDGAVGVYTVDGSSDGEPQYRVFRVKAPEINLESSVAAGDSVIGAVVRSLTLDQVEGREPRYEEALTVGVAAGSATAEQPGTGVGNRETISEVRERMEQLPGGPVEMIEPFAPMPPLGLLPIWRAMYARLVDRSERLGQNLWAPFAFVASAGFIEEIVLRFGLQALFHVLNAAAPLLGLSGFEPFLAIALLASFAALFATVFHPTGLFGRNPDPAPLRVRDRAGLFALAAVNGALQFGLAQTLGMPATLAIIGGVHALYNTAMYALGGPLAMARQRRQSTDRLATILAERDRHLNEFRAMDDETLLRTARTFRHEAQIGEFTDLKAGRGVALFSVAAERAVASESVNSEIRAYIGGAPSDRQIEAAVALLEHRSIAGMRPSEGKTLTVALAAFFQASMGRRVEVHDWSSLLSARDAQVTGAVVSRLGFNVGAFAGTRSFQYATAPNHQRQFPHLNTSNGRTNAEKRAAIQKIYAVCDIVYGPYDTMIFHWMDDWYGLNNNGNGDGNGRLHPTLEPNWVFVEESDTPLLDAAGDPLALARRSYTLSNDRERMFRTVFQFAQALRAGEYFDVLDDRVQFHSPRRLAAVASRLEEQLNGAGIRGLAGMLDEQGGKDLLLAALEAIHVFRSEIDYFVINGRIVIRDPTSGEVKRDRRWARNIHTFVEIKEGERQTIPVQDPSQTDSLMTTRAFYNTISAWSGVAGVLDEMTQAQLRQHYRARIHDFQPVYESRLRAPEARYFRTEEAKLDAVVAAIRRLHVAGRPIVINARTPQEAADLERRLRALNEPAIAARLHVVDGRNEERDAAIWSHMGVAGAITIAAQVASRGHEIKLAEELYEPVDVAGFGPVAGLVVLSTHHAVLERLEIQVRDRSGRRSRPGLFLMFDHLAGNELLTRYARTELDALLAAPGDPENDAVRNAVELARERRLAQFHERQTWIEKRYALLIQAHLQFAELSRGMIKRGGDPKRFFNLGSEILHRANVAVQLGDDAGFRAELQRFREENVYMAGALKTPGLALMRNRPFSERLRALRRTVRLRGEDVATSAGIVLSHYVEYENGRARPKAPTRRRLEAFYAERHGFQRTAVRQLLGQTDPEAFLTWATGRPRNEVLRGLRTSRWLTMEQMAGLTHPAVALDTYSSWEAGETKPTDDQVRQIALHFIENEGFPYGALIRGLGLRSSSEILDVLEGRPLKDVLAGLRDSRSTQEVADGVGGVTKTAVLTWEKGARPRESVMRRIFAYYQKMGFDRERLRRLLNLRAPRDVEKEFAGKTPFEILELARKSIPFDQKEWARILDVAVVTVATWKNGAAVPVKAIRKAAEVLAAHGFRVDYFLEQAGLLSYEAGLKALVGRPLSDVLTGIRALTGQEPVDVYSKINADRDRYRPWEKGTWVPRPFRVRLVGHWGLTYQMPQELLRKLLRVPAPQELIESLAGKTLAEVIEALEEPYDYTDNSLARILGIASSTLSRYRNHGRASAEILEQIAIFFHDRHRLPREELLTILRRANGAIGGKGGAATVDPQAPPTGPPAGLWSVWQSLYAAVHRLAERSRRGVLMVTAFVMGIGALEELIVRPSLGILLATGVPSLGISGIAAFSIASVLYAILFATVLHRRGYVGQDPTPRPLTLRQRLALFLLALGIAALHAHLTLPWWELYPLLGAVHALYNFVALRSGGVLGVFVPAEVQRAHETLMSDSTGVDEKLAAITLIAATPNSHDLTYLREALLKHKGDETIAVRIIAAMVNIRRTSVLNQRPLLNESLIGIVWHALRDFGFDRRHFELIELPDTAGFRLVFRFPPNRPFNKLDEVVRRLEELYVRKNAQIAPAVTSWTDPDRPDLTAGHIDIRFSITSANLTDFQRGLGSLDFILDDNGRYRPLIPMELADRLEERVWMLLAGLDESDPRRRQLITDVYGDGTPDHPGVLTALRNQAQFGDLPLVKLESTDRLDVEQNRPRSGERAPLNRLSRLAHAVPYASHFTPEEGIQRWGLFARGGGSFHTSSFLKGLFRGKPEDNDHMIYISRDTIGHPVYQPMALHLAELYGVIARVKNPGDAMGEDGSVKNFTLYRLAHLHWLRRRYYLESQITLPNGKKGFIPYRRATAWHDSAGHLHELLQVFPASDGQGNPVAVIYRTQKPVTDSADRTQWTDPSPVVARAVWSEESGERPFTDEELAKLAMPPAHPDHLMVYAMLAIRDQLLATPFLNNLVREKDGAPLTPRVALVEEIGLGSVALLTTFVLTEVLRREETEVPPPPGLPRFRSRDPHQLSEAEGAQWERLEQQYRDARRTGESVEVELFIGKPRDPTHSAPLPGFPMLSKESIMSFFDYNEAEAEDVINATTEGADKVPHAYAVNWNEIKGQPVLGRVPIALEDPSVRVMAFLKDLLIYNGVVRYYRRGYRTLAARPLIRLLRDPSTPPAVHDAAMRAIAEFSFGDTLRQLPREARAHPDQIEAIDRAGIGMFESYFREAFNMKDGRPESVRYYELAKNTRNLLNELAGEDNPLPAVRELAAHTLTILETSRQQITVVGMTFDDYRRLTLEQISALRSTGHYPAPLMAVNMPERLQEAARLEEAYGAREAREMSYDEVIALLPEPGEEGPQEWNWFRGGLASVFIPLFDDPALAAFRVVIAAAVVAFVTVGVLKSRRTRQLFRGARSRLLAVVRRFTSALPSIRRRESRVAAGLVSAMMAARKGDRRSAADALNRALDGLEHPIDVGQNPLSRLPAAVEANELDRERLALEIAGEWKRRTGGVLTEPRAAELLAEAALSAGDTGPLVPARERGDAGLLWVLDESNVEQLAVVLRDHADGRLLIAARSPVLLARVRAMAAGKAGVDVLSAGAAGVVETGARGTTLRLAALEREAKKLWGEDYWASARLRVMTPPISIDSDGLAGDSRIRDAIFVILDAVRSVQLPFGTINEIATLARLIGRQA